MVHDQGVIRGAIGRVAPGQGRGDAVAITGISAGQGAAISHDRAG